MIPDYSSQVAVSIHFARPLILRMGPEHISTLIDKIREGVSIDLANKCHVERKDMYDAIYILREDDIVRKLDNDSEGALTVYGATVQTNKDTAVYDEVINFMVSDAFYLGYSESVQ